MKKKQIILAILYFIFGISINLAHPVTPAYVESLELPKFIFGFLYSAMSLGVVIGALLFGNLSDKFGRKIFIILGMIGYAFGQFCFGYLSMYPYLFIFYRFISGFFISFPQALFIAEAASVTNNSGRVKYFGLLAAISVLSGSFGYKIGGFLNVNGMSFKGIFNIQIMVSLGLALLVLFFLKSNAKNENSSKNTMIAGFKYIFKANKRLLFLLILLAIITIAQTNVTKYLDVLITDLYNPDVLGNFVLATSIIGVAANVFILPIINRKAKEKETKYLFMLQLISGIAIFMTFTIFRSKILIMLYSVFMIYMIVKTLTTPLETDLISQESKEENYGMILGARQSFLAIGQVIGPLFGGFLYGVNPYLVFYFSAFLFLIVSIFLLVYNKIYGGIMK